MDPIDVEPETQIVPAKMGRPTLFSPTVESAIIEGVAAGKFLSEVCEAEGMPSVRTVDRWTVERDDFRLALARAREVGAEGLVREGMRILDECDTSSAPPVTKAVGQANYRKWLAGCHARDRYGDTPMVNVSIGAVNVAFARLSAPVNNDDE